MKSLTNLANFLAAAFLVTASSLLAQPSAPVNRLPQGGGTIYPAWTAKFWANPKLEGKPTWERSDIRVRFDWGDWAPIIGVRAESVRDFPRENISAQWTAKLVSRFAETYTFELESDEQARLMIREENAPQWTTLIDAWAPHTRRKDTAKITLSPDKKYDIQIDYANLKGDAVCSLFWSSPSTPHEVIDYVSGNVVHFVFPHSMADLFSFNGDAIASNLPRPHNVAAKHGKVDENGWPTEDFSAAMLNGQSHYVGTGQIVFTGLADVTIDTATFIVDGKEFPKTLPKGTGYDAAKNETRALVRWDDSRGTGTIGTRLDLKNTQREPTAAIGSGVTGIQLMIPRKSGGNEPHEPGEVLNGETREAYLPIFAFRVQRTGLNEIEKWDERTLPTYSKLMGQVWSPDCSYEKLVLCANEAGRDLHLNYSDSCDEEFMTQLAYLIKYGSDGKNAYTKPTPNPVWPPLNKNLRLYLEHGNEMGWSAIQPRRWAQRYEQMVKDKDPLITNVINFDGKASGTVDGQIRYHVYRSALMGKNMRAVWGDAAMGETVRNCVFGQYERYFQNSMMQFMNDFFNNPKHVKDPRPVSWYFWGAGPAVYYGNSNVFMGPPVLNLKNGNFEDFALAKGQAVVTPKDAAWTFEGNAGVIDVENERHSAILGFKAAESIKVNNQTQYGFKFTVGDKPIYVFETGHVVPEGGSGNGTAMIYFADGRSAFGARPPAWEIRKASAGESVWAATNYSGWPSADAALPGVWKLEPGESYIVVSTVSSKQIPSAASQLQAGPGIRIDGGVTFAAPGRLTRDERKAGLGDRIKVVSGAGTGFPMANLRYGFATEMNGLRLAPSDPRTDQKLVTGKKTKSNIPSFHHKGTKAAFLAGSGKLTQTFTVEHKDEYALVFMANAGQEIENHEEARIAKNPFTIKINDQVVWDRETIGSGRKFKGSIHMWATRYTPLEPGQHTLTIESFGKDPLDTIFFYSMHLGAILRDYAGGPDAPNFFESGEATGGTASRFEVVTRLTCAEAQLWGLVPYAYEGGFNAGGDWGGGKLFYANQFKWSHPLSKVADNNWAKFYHKFGGADAMYYYAGYEWERVHLADTYMPWAAAIDRAHEWQLEPNGADAAPIVFTNDTIHYQCEPGANWQGWTHPFLANEANIREALKPTIGIEGMWKGFVFTAPKAGEYTISVATSAGGQVRVLLNDAQRIETAASGQPVTFKVWLHQGIHAVRVMNIGGSFDFQSLSIQ